MCGLSRVNIHRIDNRLFRPQAKDIGDLCLYRIEGCKPPTLRMVGHVYAHKVQSGDSLGNNFCESGSGTGILLRQGAAGVQPRAWRMVYPPTGKTRTKRSIKEKSPKNWGKPGEIPPQRGL